MLITSQSHKTCTKEVTFGVSLWTRTVVDGDINFLQWAFPVPNFSPKVSILGRKNQMFLRSKAIPIGSHGTGIFTYIWLICMVNVGKYTIHGWYGIQLHNDKIIKIQIQHSEISLFARPCKDLQGFSNKKVVAYSNSTDRYQHLRAPSVSSTVTKGFLACGIKSNTFQRC